MQVYLLNNQKLMNSFPLPQNLPAPEDDGASSHLLNKDLPSLSLIATNGQSIDLAAISGWLVIYVYPRTGKPGQPLPEGWDSIPGARGCTPQSCSFRNLYQEYKSRGVEIFGLSSQDTEYQRQVWKRLQLPFQLLSDEDLKLKKELSLPTFVTSGMELYKRLTLVVKDKNIVKVFYPVFPPDKNGEEVLDWIKSHQ